MLDLLHEPRFAAQAAKRTEAASSGQRAQAPAEIYTALLDEDRYYCSIRTMYRLLDKHKEVRERRNQLRHPEYTKPELLAERPNEVWSWDITKLKGPAKWTYYYLYVVLDIYSRRVVGWQIAEAETATLFEPLFHETVAKHNVPPGQLTLHADRGGPMKAKATALLLSDLGVIKSHSRPHTSNDNPYSEAHFKTLPDYASCSAASSTVQIMNNDAFRGDRRWPAIPCNSKKASANPHSPDSLAPRSSAGPSLSQRAGPTDLPAPSAAGVRTVW